jgi:ribosomal protein L23
MKLPKRRFIRHGQRHYYRKGSQSEIDQRRGFVARMLDAGATKTEIHRAVRDKFNVQWRQCDRYIAFVTGTNTGTDTRLARVRAGLPQTLLNKMHADLKFIYGDNAK